MKMSCWPNTGYEGDDREIESDAYDAVLSGENAYAELLFKTKGHTHPAKDFQAAAAEAGVEVSKESAAKVIRTLAARGWTLEKN